MDHFLFSLVIALLRFVSSLSLCDVTVTQRHLVHPSLPLSLSLSLSLRSHRSCEHRSSSQFIVCFFLIHVVLSLLISHSHPLRLSVCCTVVVYQLVTVCLPSVVLVVPSQLGFCYQSPMTACCYCHTNPPCGSS